MTPRGAASPDAHLRVTAGTSPRRDRAAPDGPGPTAPLGPLSEAEATARPAVTTGARGETPSASDRPPSRFWLILVDDDALWLLDPRKRITTIQVTDGAL